jgi:hypothetical protein
MRGGRVTLHHDFRVGQIGQVEGAAAMVGVGMRVDQVIEPKAMVGSDRDITAGIFLQRIDQHRAPGALAGQHVGLAFSPIQFPAKHGAPPLAS